MSRAPSPQGITPAWRRRSQNPAACAGRQHDFPPILAGVPGARDEPVVGRRAEERPEVHGPRSEGRIEQRRGFLPCIRALHGDHRQVEARLDRDLESARVLAQPGDVLVARACVHDHPVPVVVKVIDDQVVDDPAVLEQHAGVERLAGLGELCDVVGEHPAQEVADPRTAQVHDTHVGHVEHARVATHAVVLLDLRAVIDRHVPATEVDHARAAGDVRFVERSAKSHLLFPAARNEKRRRAAQARRPSVL